MSWLRRDGLDLILQVQIQPRASRDAIAGLLGDRLKICLTAPPVEGKANEYLIAFLAKAFDVPKSRVILERGAASRRKQLRIRQPGRMPEIPGLGPG